MRLLAHTLLNGIGLLLAAWIVPGIYWSGGLLYLFLAGLVIGLINTFVKPFVTILSIPLIVVTLGLFYLAINGAMLLLAGKLLDGLTVEGWGPAILGGLVLGLFNWTIGFFAEDTK